MVTSPGLSLSPIVPPLATPGGVGPSPGVGGAAPGQLTVVPALGTSPGPGSLGGAGIGSGLTPVSTTPPVPTAAPELFGTTGLSGTAFGTPSLATSATSLQPVGAFPLGGSGAAGPTAISGFGAIGTPALGAQGAQPSPIPGGTLGALTIPAPTTTSGTAAVPVTGIATPGTTAEAATPATATVPPPTVLPTPMTPTTPTPPGTAAAAGTAATPAGVGTPPAVAAGVTPQSPVPHALGHISASATPSPLVYQATLDPLNASNVHGTVTAALSGDSLTVTIQATGLAPSVMHPQFLAAQSNAAADRLPTAADDANHDGLIDANELTVAIGQPVLDLSTDPLLTAQGAALAHNLSAFPVAGPDGSLTYQEVFLFNPHQPDSAALLANVATHLANGAVVMEGTTGNNAFAPALPAAIGLLHEATISGQGTPLG